MPEEPIQVTLVYNANTGKVEVRGVSDDGIPSEDSLGWLGGDMGKSAEEAAVRPEIMEFASLMEARMRENDKTLEDSWRVLDSAIAIRRAARNLVQASANGADANSLVDTANYAMFAMFCRRNAAHHLYEAREDLSMLTPEG